MQNTFETMNRKLEQFLYLHGISHMSQYKNVDGMNVWVYNDTDNLRRVVAEFRSIWGQKRSA
jgi:hypothetical protein